MRRYPTVTATAVAIAVCMPMTGLADAQLPATQRLGEHGADLKEQFRGRMFFRSSIAIDAAPANASSPVDRSARSIDRTAAMFEAMGVSLLLIFNRLQRRRATSPELAFDRGALRTLCARLIQIQQPSQR